MNITIRDLTKAMGGELIIGDPRARVTAATVDSRKITPGSAFFAFKGENSDGHAFALSACRQGASAVVVSNLDWYHNVKDITASVIRVESVPKALQAMGRSLRSGFKGPVVGITGSNGKTTTKQMTAAVLKNLGPGLSTAGNFNSQIGLPLVLSTFKAEDKWAVLEMGASEPGNIAALADIARPTIGIITSIGPAHLATFGTIERVAETKWELMDSLGSDGVAIVPWQNKYLEPHVRAFTRRIVFFGEDSSCPVRATAIEVGANVRFRLHLGTESAMVKLPIGGRVNVANALAAAAAGWVLKIPIEKVVSALETFEPPKMRMELITHSSGAIIINDAYNANPASMSESLRSINESYPNKRRVAVLGAMKELGESAEKFHFHLGVELGRFNFEKVLLMGEEMKALMEGALSTASSSEKFVIVDSHEAAAKQLLPLLNDKTVILFKGSRTNRLEKIIEALTNKDS